MHAIHLQMPPIAWFLFVLSIAAAALLFVAFKKLKPSKKQDKKKKRQAKQRGGHNQPIPPAPASQTTPPAPTSQSEYGTQSHLPPEESESDTPSDVPPLENVSDTDIDDDNSASGTHLLSSKQLILNGVKDQYLAKRRQGKITGASVIEYEIECAKFEGNHYDFKTPRQVTVFFEDGKAVESTVVPYSRKLKKVAVRHFQNSSGLAHQNLLNPKFIAFDEGQEQWYIFYDNFCCTYNQWTDKNNCTDQWWIMFIKKMIKAIQYMHNKDQIHGELKKASSYAILCDDVMIFNINGGKENYMQRFQDLSDFGEFITDKFPITIVDRTQFLNSFKNGGPTYAWKYDDFVTMLINHPTLMSEFNKLKRFADIHQSNKHRTRINGPQFRKVIKGPTFKDFRNWDTKIVKDSYLSKIVHTILSIV